MSEIRAHTQQETLRFIRECEWTFKIHGYKRWGAFLWLKKEWFDDWLFIPKNVFSNAHILADILIQLYVLRLGFIGHPKNEYSVAKTLSKLFWKWTWNPKS